VWPGTLPWWRSNVEHVQLKSPGKLRNWSQWCLRANGLLDNGLHWWVLKFFQHFLSFCWCLVALNVSSSTDTRPALKYECHSKTAVRLKECYPKASWSISTVSVADLLSFTQNLMQTHCSILPSIADKTKHEVEKTLM
jgi:hypothetical protein